MKETIDVFEILGKKSETRLDVSKILKDDEKQNQEQQHAPDFDLFQIMKAQEPKPAPEPIPAPEPKPAPKPAPAPKPEPAPEPKPAPKPEPAPEPKPAPKPEPAPEPIPAIQPARRASTAKSYDSKATPAPRPDKKPRSRRLQRATIKVTAVILIIAIFTGCIMSGFNVPADNMAPAISKGDTVIVNKLAKSYRVGDIIMFRDYHEQKCFARIVATEGDLVDIRKDGKLYLNNHAEEADYVIGETLITDENVLYPLLISENEFFVMGDNRENSTDSRDYYIGTLSEEEIVGKVVYCIKKMK